MLGARGAGAGVRRVPGRPGPALRARVHDERRVTARRVQRVRRGKIASAAVADERDATRKRRRARAGRAEIPGADRVAVRARERHVGRVEPAVHVGLIALQPRLEGARSRGRDRRLPELVEVGRRRRRRSVGAKLGERQVEQRAGHTVLVRDRRRRRPVDTDHVAGRRIEEVDAAHVDGQLDG